MFCVLCEFCIFMIRDFRVHIPVQVSEITIIKSEVYCAGCLMYYL